MELIVRNVNEALYRGAMVFDEALESSLYNNKNSRWNLIDPRDMPTIEYSGMWVTTYQRPMERVLFSSARDANPFFHFMEGLWMIAGRNDVEWIAKYNSHIHTFSDDGVKFNGAYGHRLRKHFGVDQLDLVISSLKDSANTRRAVAIMFDPRFDYEKSLDIPCNDMIAFKIRNNRLNMRVYNRSNDMIWGAYGANAVHFSMIMEYVASMIGVDVGEYSQVSDCMHLYLNNPNWPNVKEASRTGRLITCDSYDTGRVKPYHMVQKPEHWDLDLRYFISHEWGGMFEDFKNSFFNDVAIPMRLTWKAHKENRQGMKFVNEIQASDWRLACKDWLERRYAKDGN